MNYASAGQDVLKGYGAENYDRLKKIAEKYDPDEVFQRLMPGYFKVWRSTYVTSSRDIPTKNIYFAFISKIRVALSLRDVTRFEMPYRWPGQVW